MQTQVNQERCNGPGRMPGISMIVPCVAAMLLTWGPTSTGGTTGIPAPALLSAILVPAYGANEVADPAQTSVSSIGPVCGRTTVQEQEAEGPGGFGVNLWCVTATNLVDGAPADGQGRADVATFVEWHVQARHLAQYDPQITLNASLRPEATGEGRPTAVSVAPPLWTTLVR